MKAMDTSSCSPTSKRSYAKNFVFRQGFFDPSKDKTVDPAGYFLIRINRERQCIELAHCTHDHTITEGIKGKTAEEIYATVIRRGLVTVLEYAAYLGAELKKAEFALMFNHEYVQD